MSNKALRLRVATQSDVAALEAFLAQHSETSMFLRGNLAAHGVGQQSHPHATTYWIAGGTDITGVIGCSNGGYLMCQAPQATPEFWAEAVDVLQGRQVNGVTGVPEQVDAWVAALGIAADGFSLRKVEPLYRLSLDQLVMPDMRNQQLRAPIQQDLPMLADWFEGYAQDTGIAPMGGASGIASAQMFAVHPAARILVRGSEPVAMTSLNAQLPDIVQVGGVYVPPAQRGQGFARAIVAAQLDELRSSGVQDAILFAASAAASRAYEHIGFTHIGGYQICLFKEAVAIKGGADVLQT